MNVRLTYDSPAHNQRNAPMRLDGTGQIVALLPCRDEQTRENIEYTWQTVVSDFAIGRFVVIEQAPLGFIAHYWTPDCTLHLSEDR